VSRVLPDWIIPRAGLGTVIQSLYERECSIAYLGASVTAQQEGYRIQLHQRLVEHFQRHHRAINAGIGGVGTITSVFLMDDLVLVHRPHLCVIELTTGDSIDASNLQRIGPVVEGVVRKLLRIGCAAIVVHGYREETDGGQWHASAIRQWEHIAENYGIPSLHLHRLIAMHDPSQRRRWFYDGVHTTPEGAQFIAAAILDGISAMPARWGMETRLPAIFPDHFECTRIVPVVSAMAGDPSRCSRGIYRFVYPWLGLEIGNPLCFSDVGDIVGLLVVVGPDSGVIKVETDRGFEAHNTFDQWCFYERLSSIIFRGPAPLHTVCVRVSDELVNFSITHKPLPANSGAHRRLRAIGWMVQDDTMDQPGSKS